MSAIPVTPSGIDLLTIAFAVCLFWAWKDGYKTVTGQRTMNFPTLQLVFVLFWVGFLCIDAWIMFNFEYTATDYFETFVIFNWLCVSLLEFGHADRETLGIPESL